MRDSSPPGPEMQRMDQLLFGGLAGLCVAVVIQVIDKEPQLDNFLGLALLCFAVALPMLVSSFLLDAARPGKGKPIVRILFDLTGVALALVGFILLFFHLHVLAGSLFAGATAGCIAVVLWALRE